MSIRQLLATDILDAVSDGTLDPFQASEEFMRRAERARKVKGLGRAWKRAIRNQGQVWERFREYEDTMQAIHDDSHLESMTEEC